MSFDQFYEKFNPQFHLRMNDVILLMFASFILGRWFEQRNLNKHKTYKNSNSLEIRSVHLGELDEYEQLKKQQNQQPFISQEQGQKKNGEQRYKEEDKKENEMLLEKIKLQGKKIQQRGMFQMSFERKTSNSNYVRKIQKHQIITDYVLTHNNNNSQQIVPLNKGSIIPDENSVLQISYFQKNGKNNQTPQRPKFQKRIINLRQKPSIFSRSFLEHGRFKRLFTGEVKIGQGAFGKVVEALNIIQGQKYAIKKVYLSLKKKSTLQIQRILGQIQVLSRISHPNIVQYHTCWIEYANLQQNEQISQSIHSAYSKAKYTINATKLKKSRKSINHTSSKFESYYDSNQSILFESENISQTSLKHIQLQNQQLVVKQNNQQISYEASLIPVMYIQMELCESNLSYYLRNRKNVDRSFSFFVMKCLIQGVYFLHKNNIIHRDLKPENIFLNISKRIIKIGDFGLSIHIDDAIKKNQRVGTPTYIAPEMYHLERGQSINLFLLDVFSLGVIYFQLLNIFQTSHERSEKLQKLRMGQTGGLNQYKQQKKLIKQMVREFKRPTIAEVLQSKSYLQLNNLFK